LINKESSYYKFFSFAFAVFISVIIITGVVTTSVASALYRKSQLKHLQQEGNMFIDMIKDEYALKGSESISSLHSKISDFSNSLNLNIYLYDRNGVCMIPSPADADASMLLTEKLKDSIEGDDFLGMSTDNYSKKKPSLLYGSRFYLKTPNTNPVKVYILAYGDTDSIEIFNIILVFVYGGFVVLGILSFYIIMKRKTFRYTDFETNFMRICKQYAQGDFSEKIETDFNGVSREISEYVNTLASHVETSEETSKTFIANVSHELRTPITTIGGFVDGILDGTVKKSRQQEYLILVSNEIKRLRILISSMLNMTKFESGTMTPNFKPTNITDLVIQVVLMFEKKIEEKHLDVEELDSNRLVAVVDPNLMQQVIYNLVENAVKFVNENGTLSFKFEKHDGMCMIGIKNTGEGLKNTEIQQVFDRFYKTDSSRGKDTTGLGLGLSISRKIIQLHKGQIVVKSVYGEYTEFQIQIPEDPTKSDETSVQ